MDLNYSKNQKLVNLVNATTVIKLLLHSHCHATKEIIPGIVHFKNRD